MSRIRDNQAKRETDRQMQTEWERQSKIEREQARESSPLLTGWSPLTLEDAIYLTQSPNSNVHPSQTHSETSFVKTSGHSMNQPSKTHNINHHKTYFQGSNEKVFSGMLGFQKYILSITDCGDFTGLHFVLLKKLWTLLAPHICISTWTWNLCWWPSRLS